MTIRFDNRVAIVTGAGSGLGRAHALGLAERGAMVVVNDLGETRPDGTVLAPASAEAVAEQIRRSGGEAIAHGADVTNFAHVELMVSAAKRLWGHVDILINNAGSLRDRTFGKLELTDFRAILDVHLMGSVNCSKAVWADFREQGYGRIVFTSSSVGLYGNFGQTNYGAAKAGIIGLMRALHLEGAKYGIRSNALAPAAATRMTEGLLPEEDLALLKPEAVTPAVLLLASDRAPSGEILCAGAGVFSVAKMVETEGVFISEDERTPETIADRYSEIADTARAAPLTDAYRQTDKFLRIAKHALDQGGR